MKTPKVVLSNKKPFNYTGELLVVFVSEAGDMTIHGDESFRSLLPKIKEFKEFTAKKEQQFLWYSSGGGFDGLVKSRRLLLLGLGKIKEIVEPVVIFEQLRVAGGAISAKCKKSNLDSVAIVLPEIDGIDDGSIAEYVIEGVLLGAYQFQKYKKKEDDSFEGLRKVDIFSSANKSNVRKGLDRGINNAKAACVARDMANEPGNFWTPQHFAMYAKKVSKEQKLKCTIIEKTQMEKLGMGGILAVNKGSEEAPKIVILEYNPKKESVGTVLLVGKGLTFDSGGISLKPAQNMMDMKYDMCGGAAVLSALEAIAVEGADARVVAIVPSTDNMAGGGAVKPGDVITHYGGITSEIENTDAEGRLILADALAYGIEQFQPDCIIDLATLTGAVIFALGHHYSGLLSNNDLLAEKLTEAGRRCGEPIWRLPLGEMYAKQIKSKVADIKNTGGRPGGCITAGEYLHKFVGEIPWAHLDIAGTAFDFTEKSYIPKGPSGFGVRTLIEFIRQYNKGCIDK